MRKKLHFELDELSKAIFIQNSLIATWAIAYSIRMFSPYSSKYNLAVVLFRSTVTILNGSAMLMMIFYEGMNDCSPGFTIVRFFLY
jgi:formate hydrogenlyase subunit 3/multisubunit Na+/H+ antiporter MnhD subunit